jgi:DNA-directed RNA polymerase specialized sigma24 family protein
VTEPSGEASFDEFVRARAGALVRTAYLLTGDRHHAEDLVQSTLARAAVRWTHLDDPESYVRRVLYTQAVSWWRVRRRRHHEVLSDAVPEPRVDHRNDPELRIMVARAHARLTPKHRLVAVTAG